MTVESRADPPHHFGGLNTRFLTNFVATIGGPGALEEMLHKAGETRSTAELMDVGTWSSYDQFQRLLAAAREQLGSRDKLAEVPSTAFSTGVMPELVGMLQSLGSPDGAYDGLGRMGEAITPIVKLEPRALGPRSWVAEMSFLDGFEPFKDYCAYTRGLLSEVPRMFGMEPAAVVEEACQCDGAPACRFQIRWEPGRPVTVHDQYNETRIAVLEAQLESLKRMVSDLVSGEDVDEVLKRIVAAAARVVPAPGYVLAVEAGRALPSRVYAQGMGQGAANELAEILKEGKATDDSTHLVVEVASQLDNYGYLAAVNDDGQLFELAKPILEPYGRFAAAALDFAITLADTRRQAATSSALLELSTALSEIVSIGEMAGKLARAIPKVIDCDHVLVVLVDQATSTARMAGSHGFATELQSELLARRVPITDIGERSDPNAVAVLGDRIMSEILGTVPITALVTVPIVANSDHFGWIATSVADDPTRLQSDVELGERLRGLAAQAATAIANTYLVDQIRHQALHDALTGLPNRTLVIDRIQQTLARAARNQSQAALLLINLDNFKDINDYHGHATGDELLQAVAARLSRTLRGSDTVGRLGSDDFVVLTDVRTPDSGVTILAERLLKVLRQPFHLEAIPGTPISITASIGISVSGEGGPADLMHAADVARSQAKAAGKQCYVRFQPKMQAAVHERLALEMDLRDALSMDQFALVYQPIIDLQHDRVSGAEALLRWRHPVQGIILPDRFIPLLEDNGMIIEVGRWVLEQTCAQAAAWHRNGYLIDLSVNASARQFETDEFVEHVQEVLASTHLDPSALIIEITETAIMRDTEATASRLLKLKNLGVRIAVDDFGTGYSTMAYLGQLPIDILKIDRSFIAAMTDSVESKALIHTFMELSHALGLEAVAEGIEEPSQRLGLQQEACESGQGYLFSPPLEPEAFERFLVRSGRSEHPAASGNELG